MVNKVRVTIAGAPYAIATTDTENYITALAKKLDDQGLPGTEMVNTVAEWSAQ